MKDVWKIMTIIVTLLTNRMSYIKTAIRWKNNFKLDFNQFQKKLVNWGENLFWSTDKNEQDFRGYAMTFVHNIYTSDV